ncbi:MAG: hypothetical protein R6V53_02125 [Candidatus Woesearchaeota archaeon]
MQKNLEGRLVLLSSDTPDSRKLRDDLFRDFSQDHQLSQRVLRLDSKWKPYRNQEENFAIVDPAGNLNMEDIQTLIRNSDTYIVSKIESPVLAHPLKSQLSPFINKLGREYFSLKETKTDNEFKGMFGSITQSELRKRFLGVIDKEQLDYNANRIAKDIKDIFEQNNDLIRDIFREANHTHTVDIHDPSIIQFTRSLSGYLMDDIMRPRHKQICLDEVKHLAYRIGRNIIQPGDTGRMNLITPFLDGRSDHNDLDRHEGIRAKEFADHMGFYNLDTLYMIRGHSQKQLDYFTENNIKLINLTYTNEFISCLAQDPSIDFNKAYVLSPDEGGLPDAMVFARELFRRTKGEFSGRVVCYKKRRIKAGAIKDMEVLGSFVYNGNESEEDFLIDENGNPLPYDIVHAAEFKEKESSNYIGKLFDQEEIEKENLKTVINGHVAFGRDDICDSGGTLVKAMKKNHELYGSPCIPMTEHTSFTGDAIEKLTRLHEKNILKYMVSSTSIVHPDPEKRPWNKAFSISRRFYNRAKPQHMSWLQEHYPSLHERLNHYCA